jgi:HAD superfamily hydrolase (TIGR01484 family)
MKQHVYIFDVDGVLNNLQIYKPDARIIAQMADLLEAGTFVAINTGRGYEWIEENVVLPLRKQLVSADSVTRLFVAVEMGGLGVEFSRQAEQHHKSAFSLTQEQIAEVKRVFQAHPEYTDRLHWYPKESMATLDKNDNTSMEDFRPAQKELTAMLQEVFKDQHVKVANSNDAVDIHAPEAGKWAGAQLIYDWLRRRTDVPHDHFICFGDSMVDYEMARFFAEQSHDTTFVFTGAAFDDSNLHKGITVVKTTVPYHDGTYQYLESLATHN